MIGRSRKDIIEMELELGMKCADGRGKHVVNMKKNAEPGKSGQFKGHSFTRI